MHSWAAEAIESTSTNDSNIETLLAHHYSEAEEWKRAFPHLLAAGHEALAQYAIREAGKWLEKASSALEQKGVSSDSLTITQLWRDLAESRLHRADLVSAFDATERLARAAEEMRSSALIARAHLIRGQVFWNQDQPEAARTEFEKGLSIVPLAARVERAELLNASGVAASLGDLDTVSGEMRLREALGLWTQLGDRLGEAKASVNLGNLMVARERLDAAQSWYERTLDIGRSIPDRMVVVINLANRGMVQYWSGEYVGAGQSLREGLVLAEELGLRQHAMRITENLGRCHLGEGDLRSAVDCFEACLQASQETKSPRGWALLYLARSYFAAADTDRARKFWDQCQGEIVSGQDSEIQSELFLDNGRLAWLEGELDLAADHLRLALERAEGDGNAPLSFAIQGFQWLVNATKGLPPPTTPDVGERRPLAALLAFCAGRAFLACGRPGPALEKLSIATAIVDAIGADRLGRHAHFAAYQAALEAGNEDIARKHIDRAREITQRVIDRLPADVPVFRYREGLPPELRDTTPTSSLMNSP
jgi:tetratricopeptide (TPR) repeat protein